MSARKKNESWLSAVGKLDVAMGKLFSGNLRCNLVVSCDVPWTSNNLWKMRGFRWFLLGEGSGMRLMGAEPGRKNNAHQVNQSYFARR